MPTEEKKVPVLQFDRSTLATLLSKIDPGLTNETLTSLLKGVGGTEAAAIKALFGQINHLVLGGSATVEEADLAAILSGLDASGASGKLISLAALDSGKIAALAASDIGARYAVISGLSFAITGNPALYDNLNRDGSLFKFDPNTGEKRYTDEWLKDRSQFLAVKFNAGGETSLTVAGSQSWTFEERTDAGSSRIQVNADQSQRAAGKMVFATSTTETQTIVGSASGDRIYSGAGDDNISTGAGDDYVEGGAGGDMIDGGRGNDTLLGGQGDDQLDGNLGDDKLFGGTGADYLVGGKGNDRLDGGDGFDTYVIDSGDGADTIIDADGKGEIIFDGQVLKGAATAAEGAYKSPDGKLTYTFAGDPEEGGVLMISSDAGSMKLLNFKNGSLGITLGDGSSGALQPVVLAPEIVDFDSGNRVVHLPASPVDRITPFPTGLPVGGNGSPILSGDGIPLPIPDTAVSNIKHGNGAITTTAAVALPGDFSDLFKDPTVNVSPLTGAHVNNAIALSSAQSPGASQRNAAASTFGITTTFLSPAELQNDFGIHPRQIEYALMDFHNAISLNGLLGGDSLGDAGNIGVGTLSIGASFDSKQLSDDKYTDLGSKKIGVKG